MRALLLTAILILLPLSTAAEEIPRCTAEVAGARSCQAAVACECRWFPKNTPQGTPAGWRWDCSILKRRCRQETTGTQSSASDVTPLIVIEDERDHVD